MTCERQERKGTLPATQREERVTDREGWLSLSM